MKALVKYAAGPGNMEIRDVPKPVPGPGQVLIEIKEAGICGSDIHIYHSDIAIPLNPPVVTGHEFSGVVARNGEGCSKFAPGSRVVSETAFHYCGVCDFCREGFYNLCVERRTLGYWYNGVFTRYTVVPEARIHLLPDGVDFTSAAMTEPLACVAHAVYDLTRIVPGDVVLVSGPGAVGIMTAQIAKIHGATVVLSGMDVDAERLKLAKSLGIDRTINAQTEDLNAFLASLTGGYGADVVLECSGSPRGVDAGLNVIKKRGWFTQIGLPGKKIEFDIEKVCYKELHFSGSLGSRNASWRKALQLLGEGKVNVRPLVTDKLSVLEWERAFEKFEKKEGCKIFLLPAAN
ncbi:MAG: zinc-binding dehydrogenase [Synergistaceae bacterium]|jgi:L-iditol 2-dehydrogenase|nr:zinc-binding dehydrogenase [Synergistaceae bacterium]